MMLKNCWYVAAFADEVAAVPLARIVLTQPVVLFRDAGGEVAALEDRCCHRGLPLAHGEVVPEGIRCGYHGLVFNPRGQCVRVPGLLTINAGAKDVGTGAFEGNRDDGFFLRSAHAVTPETAHTAHYFWTIAHKVRDDMPELTDRVYQEIDAAFVEDKVIIESQFARLRQFPDPPLVSIRNDGPQLHAHKVLARRMAEESALAG